jgi:hypothetical protein
MALSFGSVAHARIVEKEGLSLGVEWLNNLDFFGARFDVDVSRLKLRKEENKEV